jgi:hypothetical protein
MTKAALSGPLSPFSDGYGLAAGGRHEQLVGSAESNISIVSRSGTSRSRSRHVRAGRMAGEVLVADDQL